jgi:hypothetical protein
MDKRMPVVFACLARPCQDHPVIVEKQAKHLSNEYLYTALPQPTIQKSCMFRPSLCTDDDDVVVDDDVLLLDEEKNCYIKYSVLLISLLCFELSNEYLYTALLKSCRNPP